MMDFNELAKTRRSVRKFLPDPISRELLLEILATAGEAPSAGNDQMWRFLVITSEQTKDDMKQIISRKLEELAPKAGVSPERVIPVVKAATLFAGAPVVIAVTTAPYRSQADKMLQAAGMSEEDIDVLRSRPDLQSIGAGVQTLLLAAWEKGLGTCWLCGPNIARPELEKRLHIEAPQTLAALVAIGKPAIVPAGRGRLPLDQIVKFLD